jgi:hypothetical protein
LVEFPFQTLLNDLQMQKPQVSAAETLAQGRRRILLVNQGRVVELVFLEGLQERLVIVGRYGIDGRKDNGLNVLEAAERLRRGS